MFPVADMNVCIERHSKREKEKHTSHERPDTGNQVDDARLDTGIGALAKGRVVG